MPWKAASIRDRGIGGVEGGDDRARRRPSAPASTGSGRPARARAARRTGPPGSTAGPGCRTPARTRAGRPSRCTGSARCARPGRRSPESSPSSSPGASTETSCPIPMSTLARSATCACTPPGMSNEYGQTRPILMIAASERRAFVGAPSGRGGRRSASHSGCSMCQSAGCRAMRRSNAEASAWVPPRTRSASRVPGSVTGGPTCCSQPSSVKDRWTGQQVGAGQRGEHRRTGRHRGAAHRRRCTGTPARGQVAVARPDTPIAPCFEPIAAGASMSRVAHRSAAGPPCPAISR